MKTAENDGLRMKSRDRVALDNYYSIIAERRFIAPDGVRIYGSETIVVFEPLNQPSSVGYPECLKVWNDVIAPETSLEEGLLYHYSILDDWGSGHGERSELRYNDELIRFDRRFKKPVRLRIRN